jgi:hypothetical protein
VIVITSAAYVDSEIQAELGKLVPSMLPIGNQRLFEHQIDVLKMRFPTQKIYLSLPEKYDISINDKRILHRFQIETVSVPEGLALSESLLYALNSIAQYDDVLRVLHGDTLIKNIPEGNDIIGISKTNDDYNWEVESKESTEEMVWCGFFAFNNIKTLVKSLNNARGNFVEAIRRYDNKHSLERIIVEKWYDLGHVNNYYKSRSKITTERDFNTLKINEGCIVKTGLNANKIRAESEWFHAIPKQLKPYIPQLIDSGEQDKGEPYYVLEYLCLSPLSELYVHGRNPSFYWAKIFNHCAGFLKKCKNLGEELLNKDAINKIKVESRALIADKTRKRFFKYANNSRVDINSPTSINGCDLPSLSEIIEETINEALVKQPIPGIMHGDFCFSNLLFDSRADVLKVIDPRGLNAVGEFSLFGDLQYDLAKLNHSVIGLYDYIIAGAYDCQHKKQLHFKFEIFSDLRIKDIQEVYLLIKMIRHLKQVDMMPITILLFFSMVPLHSDRPDRQVAFIANALRLYAEYIKNKD